jgi:hypothetical protein
VAANTRHGEEGPLLLQPAGSICVGAEAEAVVERGSRDIDIGTAVR